MSLTLRDVQLEDLETFRRWRADPRYAEMLRRPGTPATPDEAVDWYRAHGSGDWWSVWDDAGGLTNLRGYVMLTPRGGGTEVSVLTDPDAPCDAEALNLLIAKAETLGIRRLFAETYTPDRHWLIGHAGFQPVQHWTLLLRTADPATDSGRPAPGLPPTP